MSDALQGNDFRVTHLDCALVNDNFCSKIDPLLIFLTLTVFGEKL